MTNAHPTSKQAAVRDNQIAVIANPHAGKGEVKRDWSDLQERIRARLGSDVVFELTKSQGDGRKLAREINESGRHVIISIGGDGTHSEIASGILQATHGTERRGALACLHAGTGGDFRRALGLRREADILHAIATRPPSPIDAGIVEFLDYEGRPQSRYFINIASTGVAGLVDRYVGQTKSGSGLLGGPLSYISATLRALREYVPAVGEVVVDGESLGERSVQNLAVCNGQFFGGGMKIAPAAKLDDGLFDVVLVSPAPRWRSMLLAPSLYLGSHTDSDLITVRRGREIVFTPRENTAHMDIDGEPLGTAPATFRILPGVLDVWRRG